MPDPFQELLLQLLHRRWYPIPFPVPHPDPDPWWDRARLEDATAALHIRTLAGGLADERLQQQVIAAISEHPAVAAATVQKG